MLPAVVAVAVVDGSVVIDDDVLNSLLAAVIILLLASFTTAVTAAGRDRFMMIVGFINALVTVELRLITISNNAKN